MRLATLALVLLALTAPVGAAEPPPAPTAPQERQHPLVGKIWLPAEKRFATADEVVERARAADAVLLGETHDNPDHHALQAWMLGRLLEGGRRPLVAFEMIDAGQEEALRRHLADHPGDTDGLGDALNWRTSGWPDWALYRPIAAAALAAGAPLTAANLTREQVRAVAKGESLTPLPPLADAQMAQVAAEIRDGHCGLLPDAAITGMVRVQRQRDTVMAAALARGVAEGRGAVLIAGSGHVRTDHGVPLALAARAPEARTLALSFAEVHAGEDDPAAYDGPFDAVWFTPRAERQDMCAAMRRHMDKAGK